jgi:hypothetical protein
MHTSDFHFSSEIQDASKQDFLKGNFENIE